MADGVAGRFLNGILRWTLCTPGWATPFAVEASCSLVVVSSSLYQLQYVVAVNVVVAAVIVIIVALVQLGVVVVVAVVVSGVAIVLNWQLDCKQLQLALGANTNTLASANVCVYVCVCVHICELSSQYSVYSSEVCSKSLQSVICVAMCREKSFETLQSSCAALLEVISLL